MLKSFFGLSLLFLPILFVSCVEDDENVPPVNPPPAEESEVVFNFDDVPYETLSEYNFFDGTLADFQPSRGVLPYDVITPLFSDYAKKSRFVWMPDSVKATYNGDHNILSFQDGTVLIKNFYYENVQPQSAKRVIETRIIFMRNNQWEFAEYVWNDDQTEAYLDLSGSNTDVTFIDDSGTEHYIDYRIPSESECFTCHKLADQAILIGPKPQNLNADYAYTDGVKNQLEKWVEVGYLENNYPANINTTVAWDDPSQLLEDRVRSYLDMNCAHCHRDGSHCDYRPIRLAFEETLIPENIGLCVEPQTFIQPELTYIIAGGNPDRSTLYYRLNSVAVDNRMPLLGRTVVHEEGLQLIYEYINSLDPC